MSRKIVFITITLLLGAGLWWYGGTEPDLLVRPEPPAGAAPAKVVAAVTPTGANSANSGLFTAVTLSQTMLAQPEPEDSLTKDIAAQNKADTASVSAADQVSYFINQAQQSGAIPYQLAEQLMQQPDWQHYVSALVPDHQLDFTLKDEIEQALYQQLAASQYRDELQHFNCGGGFCFLELSGESEQQLEDIFRAAIKTQRVRAIFSSYQAGESDGRLRLVFSYSDAIPSISVPKAAK